MNSRAFNLHRYYFNSVLNSAAKSKFKNREKIRLLVFTFPLTVHLIKKFHAVFELICARDGKEMYPKVWCTCRVVVLHKLMFFKDGRGNTATKVVFNLLPKNSTYGEFAYI